MKKGLLILVLLLTVSSLWPTQKLAAQFDHSPWNAPRWSSVQVTYAVRDWLVSHNLIPDEEGEFARPRYIDFERGVWTVVITWYIDGEAGETMLLVSSNGSIIEVDPTAATAAYVAALIAGSV